MTNEEETGDRIFVPVPELLWKHDAALLRSLRSSTPEHSSHGKSKENGPPAEGEAQPNWPPRGVYVRRKRASLPSITMKSEKGLYKDHSGRLWTGDYLLLDKMDFKAVGLDVSDSRGLFVRLYGRTESSMKTVSLGKLSCAGFLSGARQVRHASFPVCLVCHIPQSLLCLFYQHFDDICDDFMCLFFSTSHARAGEMASVKSHRTMAFLKSTAAKSAYVASWCSY
jgi:hypothetical protein